MTAPRPNPNCQNLGCNAPATTYVRISTGARRRLCDPCAARRSPSRINEKKNASRSTDSAGS